MKIPRWLYRRLPRDYRYARARKELDTWHEAQQARLKSTGTEQRDDLRSLEAEYINRARELDWQEGREYTEQLLKEAHKLWVPVPESRVHEGGDWRVTEDWEEGPSPWEPLYLSPRGIGKIRAAIREEVRWRMEKRQSWLPFVAAATGIVGALTGLFAVVGAG